MNRNEIIECLDKLEAEAKARCEQKHLPMEERNKILAAVQEIRSTLLARVV
jgi:hypothetical protein